MSHVLESTFINNPLPLQSLGIVRWGQSRTGCGRLSIAATVATVLITWSKCVVGPEDGEGGGVNAEESNVRHRES